jgi:hypothetical protein
METLKEYKNIVFLILALLIFCLLYNNTSRRFDKLDGQYDVLKEQYSIKKDGVQTDNKKYILVIDSIKKEIYKKEAENKVLLNNNNKLEQKINSILKTPKNIPKDLIGLVSFYNERYVTSKNKVVEEKVGLTVETAMDVSNDLVEGDRLAEILPLKNQQLKNLDSTVINLNSQKEMLSKSLSLSEEQIKNYQDLQKLADQNILTLEKQNKTLKKKNFLNKVLIPVSVATGVFIGTKIK